MELLTVYETATMLKVSPITIRRYIADGKLPAVKIGRGVRVKKEALDQLIISVTPKRERTPRIPRGKVLTKDDPLWKLVGIGRTGKRPDHPSEKDQALADAYLAEISPLPTK